MLHPLEALHSTCKFLFPAGCLFIARELFTSPRPDLGVSSQAIEVGERSGGSYRPDRPSWSLAGFLPAGHWGLGTLRGIAVLEVLECCACESHWGWGGATARRLYPEATEEE